MTDNRARCLEPFQRQLLQLLELLCPEQLTTQQQPAPGEVQNERRFGQSGEARNEAALYNGMSLC